MMTLAPTWTLWSAKAYDREEIEELCRKVPSLCEHEVSIWVWLGLAVLFCIVVLALLIYWVRR